MSRFFRRVAILLLSAVMLLAIGDVATYDANAWVADLDRVEADMAQGYANLDWIADQRGLDLVQLDRATRARLEDAHSRVRALLAMRDFLHAFRDPHLRLSWGQRPIREEAPAAAQAVSAETASASQVEPEPIEPPVGADCSAAGYEEGEHAFTFPFAQLSGWRALGGRDFPLGIAGDTGVMRIAQLGENQYSTACSAVFTPGIGERALQLKLRARQQAVLRDSLAVLRKAGARRLLLDVTGNGGGSEWVTEVVALMTDKAMSRAEARVVAPACDRRAVWQGKAPCSVFADEVERASIHGSGAWQGPVLLLVDRNTASAAEDLVGWLQQNHVASVIGERTMGAGCGYVDGGTRTRLRASHFDVMMPNCARYLDNGINEIEGIAPDTSIDMRLEDPAALAQALAAVLAKQS